MRERRRAMMGSLQLEWIRLGTTVVADQDTAFHKQTAAIDFKQPIYGFAVLATGYRSDNWARQVMFAWSPTDTPVTAHYPYYGGYYDCSSSEQTRYYYGYCSNFNHEYFYDREGNLVVDNSAVPSLTDIIQIDGADVAADIRWIDKPNPMYLRNIGGGIYNLQKYAILVNKRTERTPTRCVYQ